MAFKLEPRGEPSRTMVYVSPLIAVGLTVVTGLVFLSLFGLEPQRTLHTFFVAPVSDGYGRAELAVKATPLVLIALGLAVGFRANVWNIGAEGQLTLGAIFAGGLAIALHDSGSVWLLPGMVALGIVGGMSWAAIPALLKTRFNANEILVSLMLTYVASLLLSYLVHGPWRDPGGYNFPESRLFPDSAILPVIVESTRLHVGTLVALGAVFAIWLLLGRSLVGFEVKAVGDAPAAARYAGFSTSGIVWFSLLLGGGLAGLAGMLEVSGTVGQLTPSISPGYGFTAIIVAFLGRLHPVGILGAGLLMALSYLGGETAQIELGTPAAVTGVFQGMLLFFLLAADVMILYRPRWRRAAAEVA